MIILPSHTSHILQTSNVTCFKPFNTTFKNTTLTCVIYNYKTNRECHLQHVLFTTTKLIVNAICNWLRLHDYVVQMITL
jgi:hypothetical protein